MEILLLRFVNSCKRYVQTKVWVPSSPGDGVVRIVNLLNKDAPYHSGWDPEGIDTSEVDGTTRYR
eukprot:UN08492